MSHFKQICKCGRVLNQCRCPATDKPTSVITDTCPGCSPKAAKPSGPECDGVGTDDDIEVGVTIVLPRHGWRAMACAARNEKALTERNLTNVNTSDGTAARKRVAALERFVKQITLACFALLLLATSARATEIAVIVADDLREQDLAFMPNLQAIAQQGAHFPAALTAYSLCTPSRLSLVTGMAPEHHGVFVNRAALAQQSWPTIGTILHDAGWRTGMFGKWLNKMREIDMARFPGWDKWMAFEKHSDLGREQTKVLANRGSDFIRDCRRDGVDCLLYVAPAAPHGPNFGPEDCDAQTDLIPIPDGFTDVHRWRQRMSSVCGLDRLIGKIASREPTWLIVVGDNGYMIENGREGKLELVWDAMHVPLVIKGPGVAPGGERREMVSLMDVGATVLDFAGLGTTLQDGRSVRELLGPPVVNPPAWSGTITLSSPSDETDDED